MELLKAFERLARSLSIIILVLSLTVLTACTRLPGPTADDKLTQLFLELQQKHKRQMAIDGFEMDYSAVPPRTVIITLRYVRGSSRAPIALDVSSKATGFVRQLASEKYKIPDVDVRLETILVDAVKP